MPLHFEFHRFILIVFADRVGFFSLTLLSRQSLGDVGF
jgi:hypothetical protein